MATSIVQVSPFCKSLVLAWLARLYTACLPPTPRFCDSRIMMLWPRAAPSQCTMMGMTGIHERLLTCRALGSPLMLKVLFCPLDAHLLFGSHLQAE